MSRMTSRNPVPVEVYPPDYLPDKGPRAVNGRPSEVTADSYLAQVASFSCGYIWNRRTLLNSGSWRLHAAVYMCYSECADRFIQPAASLTGLWTFVRYTLHRCESFKLYTVSTISRVSFLNGDTGDKDHTINKAPMTCTVSNRPTTNFNPFPDINLILESIRSIAHIGISEKLVEKPLVFLITRCWNSALLLYVTSLIMNTTQGR